MPIPNGGLITETNEQYYAGAQGFRALTALQNQEFTTNFNTDLIFGSSDPTQANYALNNFKLYTSADGITYTEYILAYGSKQYSTFHSGYCSWNLCSCSNESLRRWCLWS